MSVRAPRPQCSFDSSAGLFAVFHALLRLLAPRHPPHALSSLTALIPPSDSNESSGRHQERAATRSVAFPPPTCAEGRARVTILCSLEIVSESLARNRGDRCVLSPCGDRPCVSPVCCEATLTATDLSKSPATRRSSRPLHAAREELDEPNPSKVPSNSCSPCRAHRSSCRTRTPSYRGRFADRQWRRPGSNRQPLACKASALPVELRPLLRQIRGGKSAGTRARTWDLSFIRAAL